MRSANIREITDERVVETHARARTFARCAAPRARARGEARGVVRSCGRCVIAIPLAALGLLNPLIAAAAMALSDVTVIGNALRLRRTRID